MRVLDKYLYVGIILGCVIVVDVVEFKLYMVFCVIVVKIFMLE